MRIRVKRAIRGQKGIAALTLVLVLLVIGGLILTPLLGLMGTGLISGQVYEKKTNEYYAADAGVTDAISRIQADSLTFGTDDSSGPWQLSVNNRSVIVEVYRGEASGPVCARNFTYQILSTATDGGGGGVAAIGSTTTIEAYVHAEMVVRNLLDNAITSIDNIDLNSNSLVTGDVQFGGEVTGSGTVNGTRTPEAYTNWLDRTKLSNYYRSDVESKNATDPGGVIRIGQLAQKTIGPSYRHGSLHIDNGGGPATLTLGGTIYVEGDLVFNQPGASSSYTIDLNGQTIFVTGNITFPSAGANKGKVSIAGSGCIIAIGDIDFWPSISGGAGDFVFVASIEGYVDFKPKGDFYGSLAGKVAVDLASNCQVTWTSWEGRGLNFPVEDYAYGTDEVKTLTIQTWEINPQHGP